MTDEPTGASPYSATAWHYRRAGWAGVLPLPVNAKSPVPRGFTGWAGSDPSGADVQEWIDRGLHDGQPAGNIGLRLPRGVYGLDVDNYGAKMGGAALERLIAVCGPLPATWLVSSREDSTSGIRLFRYDVAKLAGRVWRNEPGGHAAGIESIHFGHRYAVVWPSMHPDTGRKYRFRGPDGIERDGEIPAITDLTELPDRWLFGLSEPGEVRTGDMAGHEESTTLIGTWRSGEPCQRVVEARDRGFVLLQRAQSGEALHPAALGTLHELTNLGNEGHRGVGHALAEHGHVFIETRQARSASAGGADSAGAEWWRMVRGAIGKLLPAQRREICECDAWSGEGLDFTDDAQEIRAEQVRAAIADSWDPAPVEFVEPLVPAPGGEQVIDDGSPLALLRRELMNARQVGTLPAPRPLVAGLLYRDTLAWLIGKSGSFKSFVALDIAAHVADDRAWASKRVWGGPVLYVVAEGAGGMPLRVQAWERKNGAISERLIMLRRAVQVQSEGWRALVELARELQPVLIVLDTQARVTIGVQENDNSAMSEMIEKIDYLRRVTGACILVVHHIGRQGDDARGASSIDGAQDTELKIERRGGPKAMTAVIKIDKQKDAADTGEINVKAELIELGTDPFTNQPLSSLVTTPELFSDPFPRAPWREDIVPNQVAILDIIRDMYSEQGGTVAEVRAILRERGGHSPKWLKSGFAYAWNALLGKDCIERVGSSPRYIVVDSIATKSIDTDKIPKVQMSDSSPEPLASAPTEPLNPP